MDPGGGVEGPLIGAVIAIDGWASCAVGVEPPWLPLTLRAAGGVTRSSEATATVFSVGKGAGVVDAVIAVVGWSSCAVGVELAWLPLTLRAAGGVGRSVSEATAIIDF